MPSRSGTKKKIFFVERGMKDEVYFYFCSLLTGDNIASLYAFFLLLLLLWGVWVCMLPCKYTQTYCIAFIISVAAQSFHHICLFLSTHGHVSVGVGQEVGAKEWIQGQQVCVF